jgi:hypothetical protein
MDFLGEVFFAVFQAFLRVFEKSGAFAMVNLGFVVVNCMVNVVN